jgi:serine/threonine protein kinase
VADWNAPRYVLSHARTFARSHPLSGLLSLLLGRSLSDRYRIDSVIATGRMGVVCRAFDLKRARHRAVRGPPAGAPDEEEAGRLRTRFHREARAAARLRHPNVVTVHDFGTDPAMGIDFLVMELLAGEDLAARMRRAGGRLAVEETVEILRECGMGLAAGHRAGMVHRDVKPGNIYLVAEPGGWEVKLLDYGITLFASDALDTVTRQFGAPRTPRYASPEQLGGGTELSPASDVYSLALTGLEMLSGEHPAELNSTGDDMLAARTVRRLLQQRPEIPLRLVEVLRRSLRLDPARRFADAGAFLDALDDWDKAPPADAAPAGIEPDETHGNSELALPGLPAAGRRSVQAGHATDSPSGSDQLEIATDVEALCSVLAAREVKPPLAVGLFGDWGTGKSFFMKAMEKRIECIAKASQAAEERVSASGASTDNSSGYCAHVVQVWFNAWHYMDSNLWASLAAHVFQCLADYLENDDRREKLFATLEASRGMLAEAVVEKRVAERRLNEIAHERKKLEKNFARTAGAAFRAAVAKLRSDPEVQQKLQRAAAGLHLPNLQVQLEGIEHQVEELQGWSARLRVVFRKPLHAVMALAVFAAATGVVLWAADRLTGWTFLVRALAAVTTGLAALSGILAPLIARVSRAVGWLEEVHGRVRKEKEAEEDRQRQAELAVQRELLRLEAVEREAEARVHEMEQAIAEMRAGRRLHRFILERKASAEYHRHLGIVNLIRNDFQKLSDLLVEAESEDAPSRSLAADHSDLPRIDRIILYVDDLDRCPESRVVQVLQAVHLLLAFPLFVVVVGVDSRWLLLSLEDHYAALRGRARRRRGSVSRGDGEQEDEWSTTPQNYLEKIFQIPFTLRPMAPVGFGRLVRSLLPVRRELAEYESSTDEPEERFTTSGEIPPAHATSSPRAETVKVERTEEGDPVSATRVPPEPEPSTLVPLNPESLAVEVWELEFIEQLNSLVSSPRSLKRLTNLYRFVRARQDGSRLLDFSGTRDAPGEFQIVALLLASLVGFPREATRLFRQVLAANDSGGDFWQLVDATAPSSPSANPAAMEDGERRRSLHDALADGSMRRAFRHDASLKSFVKWIPEVARFSFESGRILSFAPAISRDAATTPPHNPESWADSGQTSPATMG